MYSAWKTRWLAPILGIAVIGFSLVPGASVAAGVGDEGGHWFETDVAGGAVSDAPQGTIRSRYAALDPNAALRAVISPTSLSAAVPGKRVTVPKAGDVTLTLFDGEQLALNVSEVAVVLDAEGGDGRPTVELLGRQMEAGAVTAVAAFTFVQDGSGAYSLRGSVDRGARSRIQIERQSASSVRIAELEDVAGAGDEGRDVAPAPSGPTADAPVQAPASPNLPVIDVLVGYASSLGPAAPGAIAQRIAEANTALATSRADVRLNLMSTVPVTYAQDPTNMRTDLDRLKDGRGGLGDLPKQREAIGADLVALIVPNVTDACGIAWMTTAKGLPDYAFSVTAFSCFSGHTLAHEIGHNIGGNHDPANSNRENIPFAFSYGHQAPGKARTIMAYDCPQKNCPRKLQFSNPSVPFIGFPSEPSGSPLEDNARSFTQMGPIVSAYRSSTPSVRLAGGDRFETAVAISKHHFANPAVVDTVVVGSGMDFPDALSGAPLAAKVGGPLLLTIPGSLPAATSQEISRLKPSRIIVVGGVNSVSATVEASLRGLLAAGGTITRLAGGDRWETSLQIAKYGWPSTGSAFIAAGVDYPDALSAGAAAGKLGGPVLLVPGGGSAVPATVSTYLTGARTSTVYIAGGTSAVSAAIESGLRARHAVVRYAGSDRFNTSSLIAKAHNTPGGSLYLAAGTNFPDALAGAAVAGRAKSPLVLSAQACVLSAVQEVKVAVAPSKIYLLGGALLLSEAVKAGQLCP